MSALGDFLETFFSPRLPFRNVQARVQHTKTTVPADSSSRQERSIGRRRRNIELREDSVESLSFWGRLPDQVCVETTRVKDGKTETSIEVVNGDTTWKRHYNGVVEQGSSSRHSPDVISLPTQFQSHFDRSLLRQCFAALTLDEIGTCPVAGH